MAASATIENCVALASMEWSPQESWVWVQLCNRQAADLSVMLGEQASRTFPWEREQDWSENRILSVQFLREILLQEPYLSALRGFPVHIFGAWFVEPLMFDSITAGNSLLLRYSRFDEAINIERSNFQVWLQMSASWFRKEVRLFASSGPSVTFPLSRFDGDVILVGNSSIRMIHLGGGQINGMVNLSGTETETLAFEYGGQPTRWGPDASLLLSGVSTDQLQDTGGSYDGLEGKLDLQAFTYDSFSRGGLINVELGVETGSERSVEELLGWLEKQANREEIYISQPYEQLASVLYADGQRDKADQILYAQNEYRRTHRTTPLGDRLWLTVKKIVIGYGYRIELTIMWLLLLIAAGAATLKLSVAGRSQSVTRCLLYSLDQALPLIEFNPKHSDLARQQSLAVDCYFQTHQIVSLILISFLGAGLAGAIG